MQFFSLSGADFEALRGFLEKVRGVINVGLESALALVGSSSFPSPYAKLGLWNIYRLGIYELHLVRKRALALSKVLSSFERGP